MKLYFQRRMSWLLISVLLLVLFGCNEGSVTSANTSAMSSSKSMVSESLSSQKAIISFWLNAVPGVITGHNIAVTMPYGTNVESLVARFNTTGKSVKVNGIPQNGMESWHNFSKPVRYVVTAADGSTYTYTVRVSIAGVSEKAITSFSFNTLSPLVGTNGVIIGNNIFVTVPYGTPVIGLIARFTTTGQNVKVNGILQYSGGSRHNFSKPVRYVVTAADKSTTTYTVYVKVANQYSPGIITSFALNGIPGVIVGNNISVTVPFGTDVTSLIAKFTTTGQYVKVHGILQTNGYTPNDYTTPVLYLVTTAAEITTPYTVTVTLPKSITAYSLDGTLGVINGHNIAVTMPYGTNVTSLIATFTTSGESVAVGSTPQISGSTPNNFTSPVLYVVTAADGSTATYTVTVTVPTTLFSCINDPVTSNPCGCLQENDGSGLIWYADGSQKGTWTNWCSHSGPAADSDCSSDGESLVTFNNAKHCGYNDWHLPTAPNASSATYVDQMGGNWGTIGTYAKNNGWTEGTSFYTWLNSTYGTNHFTNVANSYYWSAASSDNNNAWVVYLYSGYVLGGFQGSLYGVLLVRSRQ